MANSYRITIPEFLFFARRTALTVLPQWFGEYDRAADEEKIISALLAKEFLIREGEELLPHPLMAYLFMMMRTTEIWVVFGEQAFLYLSHETPILVERRQQAPGQLRVIPFEHRQSCWEYLREHSYFREASAAYYGEHTEAIQTIVREMENYIEQ